MSARIQFTTVAIAATLALASHAQAAPASSATTDTEPTTVRVFVADLDLHRDAGADVAVQRIHRAAVVVCGDEPLSSGLQRHALFQDCVNATVHNALTSSGAQLAKAAGAGPDPIETVLAANR